LASVILIVIACVCFATIATVLTSSRAHAEQGASLHISQFGFESTVPQEVWDAANEGLGPFLQAIPADNSEVYGFPASGNLEQATLAQPYRVMTILPEALFGLTATDDIRSAVTATDMWLFPIVQGNQPRAILTVDNMNGEWRAVSIGSAAIARELNQIGQSWPDGRFERSLIRVFQATSDVMLVIENDVVDVVPFESATKSLRLEELGRGASQRYTVSEIVTRLVPAVQQNINQYSE
jgi:hypothetical protein